VDCCGKAFYRATLCPLDPDRCYAWPAPAQVAYIATDFAPAPPYTGVIRTARGCYTIDYGTVLAPCGADETGPCVPTGASIITEFALEPNCQDPDCQPGTVPGVIGPGDPCWGEYAGPPVFIASAGATVPDCFVLAAEVPLLCNGSTTTAVVCFRFDKNQRVCTAPTGAIVLPHLPDATGTSSSCCDCSPGCSQETSVTGQSLNTSTNLLVNEEIGPCCCRTGGSCNELVIQGSTYERLQGTYTRQEGATVVLDRIVERRYYMNAGVPMIETRTRVLRTYNGTVEVNTDTTSQAFYNTNNACPPSLDWDFALIDGASSSGDLKWTVGGSLVTQCNRQDLAITATRTLPYRPAPPESGLNCIEWPIGDFICSAAETYVATGTLIVTTQRPCDTLACPDSFLVASAASPDGDDFGGQWA
jgi:hypothetical protein